MNDIFEEGLPSPTGAPNFLIGFSEELDLIGNSNIQTDNFVKFVNTLNCPQSEVFSVTDKSFIPRAFTDFELFVEEKSMNEQNLSALGNSFQPDVIMSNSQQRSGPDGSPALIPSASKRFAARSNLSDTGELFAPVKTLTFSDIDQSSHIEDSYVNDSRLVSTPNKKSVYGNMQNDSYDYNCMTNNRFQTIENRENHGGGNSDSSDSDNGLNGRGDTVTPEFRQLDGEDEEELANTGPFHPSTHGLSKEFMDNFVGKTGNQEAISANCDIFSPLGSKFHIQDRRLDSKTPPLHSPGQISPYTKSFKSPRSQKSPRYQQSPRQRPSPKGQDENKTDPDEIQFAMSPSKDIAYSRSLQEGFTVRNTGEKFYYGSNRNEYNFISRENVGHSLNQANVPKNLDEYFEQVTSDRFIAQRFNPSHNPEYYGEGDDLASRQGDGLDNEFNDTHQQPLPPPDSETRNPDMASLPLDTKYLQKTQVSVKLPQATYDTISANTSHDERFATGDRMYSNYPDVAMSGTAETDQPENTLEYNEVERTDSSQGQFIENLSQTGSSKQMDGKELKDVSSRLNNDQSKPSDLNDKALKFDSKFDTKESVTKPVSSLKSSESHTSPKTSEHFQTATGQERPIQSASGKSNDTNISGPDEGNPASQSQVSSRLFQETVSQRNKTTQKFVSSAPPLSKPYSTQVRDFKKPFEPNTKNNNVSYSGAKKPGTTATNSDMKKSSNEPCPRFKASDRTKPKSASNDSLNQKTTKFGGNLQRNSQNGGENSTQPRSYHQPTSTSGQGQLSRGQFNSKGQGHTGVNGEVHNSSMHSDDEGHIQGHPRIVTQVENTSPVAVERPSQSTNVRQTSQLADSSLDIKGMEEVRHQLQSMMKMSHEHMAPHDRSQYEHSDIIAGFGVEFGEQQQHHQRPMEKSWNMLRNPGEDDIMENFPSFSSQYFTDSGNVSRSDNSLHAENQRLRDMLEKERYRRKHCEQYIQQLNVKLLETQQQVAVAVSTDKRKDLMIEQLDKQLARVMEGWKKRDQEKDDMMADIQKEKEEIENNMKQQQQMISNFEHDMSEAVDALRQEKEKAGKDIEELKQEIENKDHARQHVEELLDAEKEKSDLLQQECENLREGRETLDKKLDQMQKRLHREQDEWFQREQELLQRIDEVSEKTNRVLQTERAKNEEQGKLAEEIMEQYQTALTNVKKLEMELDAALREKESVKVEMGIMEAKFENAQRVLEADLSSTMEKRIASQISDVQKRHEAITDELQEKHREQMLELSKKNGQEMEKQLNIFREEMLKKEEDFRKQFQEMESSLTEYRNENAELKRSKQKLESTRYEVLTKLQYAMQSQWNEAFSMLTSATPQRQHTQSKTPGGEEEASSTLQGPPTVNFSFFTPSELSANQTSVFQPTNSNTSQVTNQTTPPRQTANPKTPPRQSTNRSSFESTLANQISPVPKHLTNQERVLISSPGGDSVISHSTERDPNDPLEPSIETATMSHLKQIQDYMNSFAKTPEWISSITSQADVHDPHNPMSQNSLNSQQVAPPSLTSSNEFASFLSTHLNSIQQHQMTYPPSHMSSAANHVTSFHSLPNTEAVNHGQFESVSSFSLPNFHQIPNKQSMDPSKTESAAGNYPKSRNGKNMSESCHSQSETTLKLINQSEHSLFSSNNHSVSEVTGISRAIALHPPQQGTDPYSREDLDHSHTESSRGYFQGGQSFSPPTKQNKDSPSNSMEDLRNQSNKLNEEYSNLSERLDQHGSHQQELQHYIQMLLHRSPREETTTHDNDSMFSQDNEILDLNDTAQAAQLQQELDRIQQLREKQQTDISKSSNKSTTSTKHASHTEDHVQKKILTAEQLAEVTKLLNNVKGQGQGQPQSESPHVLELLELLKHVQLDKGNQSEVKRGTRPGPKGPSGSHGERHRPGASGVRRNVQFNPGKGVDHSKGQSQGQEVKSCQKNVQAKKVERKIAGSTTKGDKGPKPAAWK